MTEPRVSLHPALWLVPAAMLLLALAPLPYGYYRLLRLVVCVCSALIAYLVYEKGGAAPWSFALGFLALLFNPLIPIHLAREAWAFIDVASAVVLAVHYAVTRSSPDQPMLLESGDERPKRE